MVRRAYNLPPLSALAAFEVAARHTSFKLAADELNVTPGAVSHQIKALEAELGVALFGRVHRGVALTDEGKDLMVALQSSFHIMSQALSRMRRSTHDRAITISATTAVSSLWLTPRITRFWRQYPDVRVDQIVTDRPDPSLNKADLTIFYGEPTSVDPPARVLFGDALVPLAAPDFLLPDKTHDIAALAQLPLIHLNDGDQRWTRWDTWFEKLGYTGPLSRGRQVNNYMIALQAAQDGAGMVLGWERLVRPFLDNGSLIVAGSHRVPAPTSFHIQRQPDTRDDSEVALLESWLLEVS